MQNSFRNRVAKFWNSFSEEESQIREMMNNKVEGETLLNFVDSILQIAFHKIYFEMGINNEGKYELILTPEGNRSRLIQLHYWLQHAPQELWEKWNFYSSKPAHAKAGSTLTMYGIEIGENDIEIYPEIENERPKVNIEIYSSKMMDLDEDQRYSMLFIYLDQFIGELYTMEYIGSITFVNERTKKQTVKITELRSFINKTIEENSWPKFDNPTEIYTGYRIEPKENSDWTLREDIFSGYTSCSSILNDFYGKKTARFNEAKQDGVIFGFAFFENINVPREDIINFRGEIEDKIVEETVPYGIANTIGGATGFHFSYIDFIIYDYPAFINIVKRILSTYNFEEFGYSDFSIESKPILFN